MVDRLMEAEAEITRLHQERERWIDYTTDLQRIIEALCDRRGLPEPVSTARHHYNMAREHLAAERLAGARVKSLIDGLKQATHYDCIPSRTEHAIDEAIAFLSALAEPAGEVEPDKAIRIMQELAAAGIRFAGPDDRILGPDEVDPVTVEKCAEVAYHHVREPSLSDNPAYVRFDPADFMAKKIASAIRSLKGGRDAQ